MSELRVAVVGLGTAAGFSIAALNAIDGVRVVGGADARGDEAAHAKSFEGPVLLGVEQLRERVRFDVALVASPSLSHAALIRQLLSDGPGRPSRIWSEKPFAISEADILACTEQASENDIELRTLLHTSFSPEVLWAAQAVPELKRVHGPVRAAKADFRDPYKEKLDRFVPALGSAWIDSGINALSVLARVVKLAEVIKTSGSPPLNGEARLALADSDGCLAEVRTSWVPSSKEKSTTLEFGDESKLELQHLSGHARVLNPDGSVSIERRFDKTTLTQRYSTMLPSYIHPDDHLLPLNVDRLIHRLAATVAEMNGELD